MTTRDQQIAAAVIEAAAKECDEKFSQRSASGHPREASMARSLAISIRALDRDAILASVPKQEDADPDALRALAEDAAREANEWEEQAYSGPWNAMRDQSAAILSLIDRLRKAEAAQAHHLSEQDIAILVYRHTGINARQFPDEYAEQRKLVKATVEACMDAAPDSEGAKG